MIKFGPYWYIDWKSVKQAWKEGVRDTPVGVPDLPCDQYAVGDTFLLYPNPSARPPGHLCELDRRNAHTVSGRATVYTDRYDGLINSL